MDLFGTLNFLYLTPLSPMPQAQQLGGGKFQNALIVIEVMPFCSTPHKLLKNVQFDLSQHPPPFGGYDPISIFEVKGQVLKIEQFGVYVYVCGIPMLLGTPQMPKL